MERNQVTSPLTIYIYQITSPVIVDIRHSLQELPGITPSFSSLNEFRPVFPRLTPQTTEISVSNCDQVTIHGTMCNRDSCMLRAWYSTMRPKNLPSLLKLLNELREFELEDRDFTTTLKLLKDFLEKSSLSRLLPGWVYGFALRHRKWGRRPRSI